MPFTWTLFKDKATHDFDHVYDLEGVNPEIMNRKGVAEISTSSLGGFNSNQYFGSATVRVDNGGDNDEKEVKIFFNKEAIHPVSGNPNWFDYWQDNNFVYGVLTSINKSKTFNISTCAWENHDGVLDLDFQFDQSLTYIEEYYDDGGSLIEGNYGAHRTTSIGQPVIIGENSDHNFCAHLYPFEVIVNQSQPHINVWLGSGASRKKGAPFRSEILGGIHTYYSTLVHEVEHARIRFDNWGDGYIDFLDFDDDGYRDAWESIANQEMDYSTFPIKPYVRFNNVNFGPDNYSTDYDPNRLFEDPPQHSAGTEYEEWRCRMEEFFIDWLLPLLNNIDWSYDPPVDSYLDLRYRTQGKQW